MTLAEEQQRREVARAARLARFGSTRGGNNSSRPVPNRPSMRATPQEQKEELEAPEEKEDGPIMFANGTLNGTARKAKRKAEAEEEATQTTSRQKSLAEANQPIRGDDIGRRYARPSQAAQHQEQGGMALTIQQGHFGGGLPDPRKQKEGTQRENGNPWIALRGRKK